MGRAAAWIISLAHAVVFSASILCMAGKSLVMPFKIQAVVMFLITAKLFCFGYFLISALLTKPELLNLLGKIMCYIMLLLNHVMEACPAFDESG